MELLNPFVIKHKKEISSVNKMNCQDFNDPHDQIGYPGLKLIEEITLDGDASAVFDELSGDDYPMLLLFIDISTTTNSGLYMKPNNSSSNTRIIGQLTYESSGHPIHTINGQIFANEHGVGGDFFGIVKLFPQSGRYRHALINGGFMHSDYSSGDIQLLHFTWKNLVDELTSINLSVSTGTMSGQMILFAGSTPL